MTTIRVVVGTYGDRSWCDKAAVAVSSAWSQSAAPDDVVHVHGATLAEARNAGAAPPGADFCIFLDADDRLEYGYVWAMRVACQPGVDLYQPATRGLYPDGRLDDEAVVIPARHTIRAGNWMVIGTMVRRDLFLDAGGFGEEAAWEDWACWARCLALGGVWMPVPDAEYWVGVNDTGRNSTADARLFRRILAANDVWAQSRGVAIR